MLAEIFALSFKWEVQLADRCFYKLKPEGFDVPGEVVSFDELDASSYEDHAVKVREWMPGFIGGSDLGFGSFYPAKRQKATYALFRVMLGWWYMPSISREDKEKVYKLAPGMMPSEVELNHGEYIVARHYVLSFLEYFQRAPIIVHMDL